MFRISSLVVCAAAAFSLMIALDARAVMLYRTSTRNTWAPTGVHANSGWQWEGKWGSFVGTPIAPNYFITAGHVGGSIGQSLTLGGKSYKTTAMYDDPATDLRIWKVSTPFSSYAKIYTGTSELNKEMVTYGRGTQRGSSVVKNGVSKGWRFGTQDGVMSWGTNIPTSLQYFGTDKGYLLKFPFNRVGGLWSESTLSMGDSGGGVFVKDGTTWKLAGINYLIDGPFSLTGGTDAGFQAGIFDKGGLFTGSPGKWSYTLDTSSDIPGNWYATRVSVRASWIKSIIGTLATSPTSVGVTAVPEPASLGILGMAAAMLLRRRR